MSATEYRHPGLSLEERAKAYLDSPIGAPVTRGLVIDLMAELTEVRSRGVAEGLELDPTPWVFISDQVFGVPRSAVDKGFHSVSGTWWAFSPRPEYEQDRARYDAEQTTVHEIRRQP